MPKVAKELTALEVRRITEPGFHAVGGVPGLLLRVKDTGARGWILRAICGSKRRDFGLGGFPAVSLEEARATARIFRAEIREGIDPAEKRRKQREALRAQQDSQITFAKAWKAFWSDRSAGLAPATVRHWESGMRMHALPALGSVLVSEIEMRHIESVLRPIWREHTDVASKLQQRLRKVLDWATVKGYRTGPNPAIWVGNLSEVLPKPSAVSKREHFRALTIDDTPKFIAELRQQTGMAARALEFCILTASRGGEVRGARWSEIDLDTALWIIPAARMKMDREHRVPLSPAAVDLLRSLPRDGEVVFWSPTGKIFTDMAMLAVIKRMGYYDRTTVHGFRSVFKSWAHERTDVPHFVSEMALAHAVGDAIQQAYQRSDLLNKRHGLMIQWAEFLGYPTKSAKIVRIQGAA